jgi:hypothetical protein
MDEREHLVAIYFDIGMSQLEILAALATHGYIISLRHLKRILSSMSLTRRKHYTDIAEVVTFIQKELSGSGKLHGYRWMWQKCVDNGINVRRNDVQHILSILDPEGTQFRLVPLLVYNTGPNIHVSLHARNRLQHNSGNTSQIV